MKRPPSLDEPVAPRRKRALSVEERTLWEGVAKQVKPLRKARAKKISKAVELNTKLSTLGASPLPTEERSTAKQSGEGASAIAKIVPPRPSPLSGGERARAVVAEGQKLSSLTRREKSKLSRGRMEIDARIDLHGMTQARAHRALLAFLQHASRDGMSFVLVITGKGRTVGPESERGILRRQVPLWLAAAEFRSMVIGYDEAGIGHGGEGALYVRLRRAR